MGIAILDAFDGAGGGPSPVSLSAVVDITSDFVTAAALSEEIASSVTVDITADFVAAATLSESINAVAAINITADFVASAALVAGSPTSMILAAAIDITSDFVAAASMQTSVVFEIPEPNSPRVAVVAHSN